MASNVDPTLGGSLVSASEVAKLELLDALTTIRDEISALQASVAALGGGGGGGGSGDNLTLSGLTTITGGVKAKWANNVSGLLSMATHSGGLFLINGNVTVPGDGGFSVWLYNPSPSATYTVQRSGGTATINIGPDQFTFVIVVGDNNCIGFPIAASDRVRL